MAFSNTGYTQDTGSKFSYNTNLLDLLGYSMLGKIKSNITQGKTIFEDILPEKDFWKYANFKANYSPSPGYNLGLEINPHFVNTSSPSYDQQMGINKAIRSFYTGEPINYSDINPSDVRITGSIPFNIKGL